MVTMGVDGAREGELDGAADLAAVDAGGENGAEGTDVEERGAHFIGAFIDAGDFLGLLGILCRTLG